MTSDFAGKRRGAPFEFVSDRVKVVGEDQINPVFMPDREPDISHVDQATLRSAERELTAVAAEFSEQEGTDGAPRVRINAIRGGFHKGQPVFCGDQDRVQMKPRANVIGDFLDAQFVSVADSEKFVQRRSRFGRCD